jgi:hypothetical protein
MASMPFPTAPPALAVIPWFIPGMSEPPDEPADEPQAVSVRASAAVAVAARRDRVVVRFMVCSSVRTRRQGALRTWVLGTGPQRAATRR